MPGPGTYDIPSDSGKVVGFGSSTRYQAPATTTPSPLDYKVKDKLTLKNNAAYTMRPKFEPDHLKSRTPGPIYDPDHDKVKASKLAFSLGSRHDDVSVKNKQRRDPGPGAYEIPSIFSQKRDSTKGVSLKFRNQTGIDHSVFPGPEYDIDKPKDYISGEFLRKGFTFGGSRKQASMTHATPGPQYKIGASTLGASTKAPLTDHEVIQTGLLL